MNTQPLFSILIANYNNGQYLKGTIDSIINQDYSNWEIVLVDDHSTDNSHTLYKQWMHDKRIRIYYNETNKGCGFTKNRCVSLANGVICAFVDPDDELLPDAVSSHIECHQKYNGESCVVSRYYLCDEQLNVLSSSRLLKIPENESYFTSKQYQVEALVSFYKSSYDATIGISSDIRMGVDQDLYFKLEEVAPFVSLDKITYKYRRCDTGISSKAEDAFYWNLVVRHRTCLRRSLNPDFYSLCDFKVYLHEKNHFNEGANYVRNTKSYRLGLFFLRPILLIKKRLALFLGNQ